jgi:hypothetical protein
MIAKLDSALSLQFVYGRVHTFLVRFAPRFTRLFDLFILSQLASDKPFALDFNLRRCFKLHNIYKESIKVTLFFLIYVNKIKRGRCLITLESILNPSLFGGFRGSNE